MGKHCEECGDHPAEFVKDLGVWLCEACEKDSKEDEIHAENDTHEGHSGRGS
jgi:ribosomal protein L37AE/L43A